MSSGPSSKGYEEVVACWLPEDCGAVHVKVDTLPHCDPVELSADQAREFAARLLKLADDLGEERHQA
jgi:hypothetical protein